jgi:hypothetical protein
MNEAPDRSITKYWRGIRCVQCDLRDWDFIVTNANSRIIERYVYECPNGCPSPVPATA